LNNNKTGLLRSGTSPDGLSGYTPPEPRYAGLLESDFQSGIRDTPWFKEFVRQYGEEPDLRPMSENAEVGPNYDYRKAWESGIRPESDPYDNNRQHWPSSLPDGEMLKSDTHPTAWKEHFMRQYGVNPDSLSNGITNWLVEDMGGPVGEFEEGIRGLMDQPVAQEPRDGR